MFSPEWLCVQSRALILLCDNLLYFSHAMSVNTEERESLSKHSSCHLPCQLVVPHLSCFPSLLTDSHPPSPPPLFLSDVCMRKKTKSVALSFLPHYFVISQSNNFAFPQREIHGAVLHMPGHAEQKEKRKRITEGRREDMYRGCRSDRSERKRAFRDGRGGSQIITVMKE